MVGCDLHGVLKFSQVVGVVHWNLPLRFGRGQKYPPVGICGGAFPLEFQISLKKIAYLSILWIGNDVYNFTKIAAILNFYVNMPLSWILCVF